MNEEYPEGLFAIPNKEGQPRIIVPPAMVKPLILQTHEDIHHQHHIKVLHVLHLVRCLHDGLGKEETLKNEI